MAATTAPIINAPVLAAIRRALQGANPGETYGTVQLSNDAALMATALQRLIAAGDDQAEEKSAAQDAEV
jgi:hypothetical protein